MTVLKLPSVGLSTDLMFVEAWGADADLGGCRRWATTRLPGYFVTNCLVLPGPPRPDEVGAWTARFEAAFADAPPPFVSLAWDATATPGPSADALAAFRAAGFEGGAVVVGTAPAPPVAAPGPLAVRPVRSDADWAAAARFTTADLGVPAAYGREMLAAYRLLVEAGAGRFACAYDDPAGPPLGIGGIFVRAGLARLQWIATADAHRRRGVARAVIADLAAWAAREKAATTWVAAAFEADPVAVATYQGLGYAPAERIMRVWKRADARP